jgi:hypothetical protein
MTRAARDKPRGRRADIFKRAFEPENVRRFALLAGVNYFFR